MKSQVRRKTGSCSEPPPKETWNFCLHVVGNTGKAMLAFSNLKRICEEHLRGHFNIQVIDLSKDPLIAKRDQIILTPTLIKKCPEPKRTVFGDLSNTVRVLKGLDLNPV